MKDIGYTIKRFKFNYAGKSEEGRWSRIIYERTPYGAVKRRGRSKNRWKDETGN